MLAPERLEYLRRQSEAAVAQGLHDIRWPAGTVLELLDHIAEVEAHRCHCLGTH